jgi:hypothetical protein
MEGMLVRNKKYAQTYFASLLVLVTANPSLCRSVNTSAPFLAFDQSVPDSARPATRESLEIVVKQFVVTLKDRDVETLTRQFSKKGVVFGIDSDPISSQVIRNRMKKNEQLYCLFFDTQCLRRDPSFQKQFSLRDSLLNGKTNHWQVTINQQSQSPVGEVRLFVEGNPNRSQTGDEFCNLTYKFEGGTWKIQEVLFY